jgi:tetratricopeptide (TPR) repeat protein
MINDHERNILKMQDQIEELSRLLLNDWQALEVHTVEEKIFRALLRIGNNALAAYVEKKGTGENTYGDEIHSHSVKNWNYISVFGSVPIRRAYFWDKEKGSGVFPIDEELNLPAKHYSYLLQNWNQLLAVDGNYDSARETLERILGINIWTKQSEEINQNAALSVDEFYASNSEGEQTQPILVAEVDGKGVIIRKESQNDTTVFKPRLKKGEKNGKKKMATVTAVFGIDRNIRDVNDIVKYETDNSEKNPAKPRLKIVTDDEPKPKNKIVRATLEGKEKAFERIVMETESRDPNERCDRILLMDGETALEKKAKEYLTPRGFVIILDLFHVMERLWTLCYFFCKEGSQESVEWVRKYLTMILTGKVGYFIGAIRQIMKKRGFPPSKIQNIEKLLRYYEKRKCHMKYDEYLAKGYPIGSGVIEGTCRSFVKDRMELAGMRWSEIGAEKMLELRSIKVNGKWNNFWQYFIAEEKQRLYSDYDSLNELIKCRGKIVA